MPRYGGVPAKETSPMFDSLYALVRNAGEQRDALRYLALSIFDGVLQLVPLLCFSAVIAAPGHGAAAWLAALVLSVPLLRLLVQGKAQLMGLPMIFRVFRRLRLRLLDKLCSVPLGIVKRYSGGELTKLVLEDTTELETNLASSTAHFIVNCSITLLSLLMLIVLNWQAGLAVTTVILLLHPLNTVAFRVLLPPLERLQQKELERAGELVAMLRGIRTIRLFSATGHSKVSVLPIIEDIYRSSIKVIPFLALNISVGNILLGMALPLVILICGVMTLNGAGGAGSTLASLLLLPFLFEAVLIGRGHFGHIRVSAKIYERINALAMLEELPQGVRTVPATPTETVFDRVTFSYDGRRDAVHDISFILPRRGLIALVGPSGSGKSTIGLLLARFHDPASGEIRCDAARLEDFTLASWQDHLGVVLQDIGLSSGSVRDNILLGDPEASEEQMIAAAQIAHCHEFIGDLRNGYDTDVGIAGRTLSGGEKQRIALARAVLKKAPIILLDEVTSSVDIAHERLIRDSIEKLKQRHCVMLIAHRLNLTRVADHILVMQEGAIVEQGRHERLIEKNGLYAYLYRLAQDCDNWEVIAKPSRPVDASVNHNREPVNHA
jgi:ABC-type multidrug transport system fused ATPase/permease subunit